MLLPVSEKFLKADVGELPGNLKLAAFALR
jgi:hypothetical protein